MWDFKIQKRTEGCRLHYTAHRSGRLATYGEVLVGLKSDKAFRSQFNSQLASAPFSAFRWETPPVSATTLQQPFELVLLESPGLARTPDPNAFVEHFARSPTADVIEFPHLRRDAIMIVPCPRSLHSCYGHLAAFVREAPDLQRLELWKSVGEAMTRRIGSKPVWLSTAGAGVSWLHARLDDRPKYYGHAPYKED